MSWELQIAVGPDPRSPDHWRALRMVERGVVRASTYPTRDAAERAMEALRVSVKPECIRIREVAGAALRGEGE